MLHIENLRAGYDGVEKLHGLTFDLRKAALTAIIGPNGCGKSTLMKCAASLLKPSDGSIWIDGHSLSALSEKERARFISYMPQSRIVPDTSVRHLVTHGRYPYLQWGRNLRKEDREIVDAVLHRTGLTGYARRNVRVLSGGERQRAYLAMMLAQQTPVMLLDEPNTYLDLSNQFQLMQLLKELCCEGHAVAVVMHDLALALEFADEILLLNDGVCIANGAPEEIYRAGAIQDVFGIQIKRVMENKYIFYPKGQEVTT